MGEQSGEQGQGGATTSLMQGWPAWMRFTTVVGVPSVIAMFLVWQLVGRLSLDMVAVASQLSAHAAVTSEASKVLDQFIADQRTGDKALMALLRQICLNTARTEDQRRECAR